jgi:putative endonuclease
MYVYLLRSINHPDQIYVGVTDDTNRRLEQHNQGLSHHTSKFKPWVIEMTIWFSDHKKAFPFERWLKSGSGRAFRKRHF